MTSQLNSKSNECLLVNVGWELNTVFSDISLKTITYLFILYIIPWQYLLQVDNLFTKIRTSIASFQYSTFLAAWPGLGHQSKFTWPYRLFVQHQANNKENIKVPHSWPFAGWWIPQYGTRLHVMTSSGSVQTSLYVTVPEYQHTQLWFPVWIYIFSGVSLAIMSQITLYMKHQYQDDRWDLELRPVNTSWPTKNGRHFPDDIFKCIFVNENKWISLNISLKFVCS